MQRQGEEVKRRLEYRSQQFAKRLFQWHPEWKRCAGNHERQEEGLPVCYLQVHVPSANPGVSEPLTITAYPREIIISWVDGWHRHFGQWPRGEGDLSYMDRALDFLNRFVADEQVIGWYYREGQPTMGGFDVSARADALSGWLDPKHGQVVLRSWHGTHDRVVNSTSGPQPDAGASTKRRAV